MNYSTKRKLRVLFQESFWRAISGFVIWITLTVIIRSFLIIYERFSKDSRKRSGDELLVRSKDTMISLPMYIRRYKKT
jgi:hypothetical protein